MSKEKWALHVIKTVRYEAEEVEEEMKKEENWC